MTIGIFYQDNGIGIEKNKQNKIFLDNFRNQYRERNRSFSLWIIYGGKYG
jgi:sensor histidine kinase regulating citrate/malate metabolism